MASKYRDWDKEIMSQEDYERLQGFKNDYATAADDAGRNAAHQSAAKLREQYGYSMGSDGSQFSILNPQAGVSQETGAQLLKWQNQANNPTGQSAFYKQWTDLMNQYNSRDPFSYDMASDGLYQQYADQYTRLGNQAMQDTLGQAAALTGGYNSSYSQGAGQQAYQGYLDQLNDIVPELYQQARGLYDQEGQTMLQQAQLAAQGYNQETADYWNNLNYWSQQAANEQATGQAKYGNLVTAITNTGYSPTDAELAAAGMTREEANKWLNYWMMQTGGSGGGSGGGGRGGGGGGGGGGGDDSYNGGNPTRTQARAALLAASYASGDDAPWLDSGWLESTLRGEGYSTAEINQIISYLKNNHGWKYMYEGKTR